MKRDQTGIYEVLDRDVSVMKNILGDPDFLKNLVKAVSTAFLNTIDFKGNIALKGLVAQAKANPEVVTNVITSNPKTMAEYLARYKPYMDRLNFIDALDDDSGEKTLDSFTVWESVDAASDNFADWILGLVYQEIGLKSVSDNVNYTFFDLYDLLAYKY